MIASLRRELENTKQEVQVTKEAAANEAKRREQLELEVVQLRYMHGYPNGRNRFEILNVCLCYIVFYRE